MGVSRKNNFKVSFSSNISYNLLTFSSIHFLHIVVYDTQQGIFSLYCSKFG